MLGGAARAAGGKGGLTCARQRGLPGKGLTCSALIPGACRLGDGGRGGVWRDERLRPRVHPPACAAWHRTGMGCPAPPPVGAPGSPNRPFLRTSQLLLPGWLPVRPPTPCCTAYAPALPAACRARVRTLGPPPELPYPPLLPSLLWQVALERGDRPAAMAQYERILGKAALGRGPAEHWAHADYGWLLFQEGDTQGARQHLEDALRVATLACNVTDSQVTGCLGAPASRGAPCEGHPAPRPFPAGAVSPAQPASERHADQQPQLPLRLPAADGGASLPAGRGVLEDARAVPH